MSRLKKFVYDVLPPIVANELIKLRARGSYKTDLRKWWESYSQTANIDKNLRLMMDHYLNSSFYEKGSLYWNYLNISSIENLQQNGFANFKQTLSRNYFTWIENGIETDYSRNFLASSAKSDLVLEIKSVLKKHDFFTIDESVRFNVLTASLYSYFVKEMNREDVLMEEPLLGNPPFIEIDGKKVTQDILNSLLEYKSISSILNFDQINSIVEIGAGSGRTSYVIMKKNPKAKYIIVDIPPALYVSQTYLSQVLPERKVFKFRPFNKFSEVEEEFNKSDLIFLTPDQIELIQDKSIDLFLAIDCLHEMKLEMINFYLNQADRLSRNIFFKCWTSTKIPFDDLSLSEDSYQVPKNWDLLLKKKCPIPSTFFEAAYKIN